MTKLTRLAVEGLGLGTKESDRCRNFFALGLVYWLYDRPLEPTLRYIDAKFGKKPDVAEANRRALQGRLQLRRNDRSLRQPVPRRTRPSCRRASTARSPATRPLAWGLIAAAKLSGCELFYGSYPITPASDILHELARHKNFGVRTFQAEDEIAAITSAIGAAFGGAMGVTASSGPGIASRPKAIGLAVMTELPLIIINVQRGGPSTGLPTKTEQADLLQAMFGRNGECPVPVIAARSPADCFDVAQEAWRIAVRFMTPVILLTDGYIANGCRAVADSRRRRAAEDRGQASRRRPDNGDAVPALQARRAAGPALGHARHAGPDAPHRRPGKAGHHRQRQLRAGQPPAHGQPAGRRRSPSIADDIPLQEVDGPASGELLVLSWGGTYGACATAVQRGRRRRAARSPTAHLRYLNPFPANLGEMLKRYKQVLIPELNLGQLRLLIRGKYLVDAIGLNKVQGQAVHRVAKSSRRSNELLSEADDSLAHGSVTAGMHASIRTHINEHRTIAARA